MKKKTVMLPVEVPEGDYCSKETWDSCYGMYLTDFVCDCMGANVCQALCKAPELYISKKRVGGKAMIIAQKKLPACLEAGEEVQRG